MDVKRRADSPLVLYIAVPLAVMAFAYVIDLIFGAKFVILPGSERGIERFAIATIVVCVIEIIVAAFTLLRGGRAAAFAGLTVYLSVIMMLVLMFGTFQA